MKNTISIFYYLFLLVYSIMVFYVQYYTEPFVKIVYDCAYCP